MPYIPTRDADVDNWANNFQNLLTLDPAKYGLAAADAAIVAGQFTIWHTAYQLAIAPETRTKPAVADKDGEKLTLLQICRDYAAQIRANKGVTDEDKAALGLTIPDPTPTPVPVPSTIPVINVPLAGPGKHAMNITDQLTPDSKAKPAGVAGMLLFRGTSPTGPVAFSACSVHSMQTRSDVLIDTSDVTAGHFVTYYGKWYNRKGQFGGESAACTVNAM